MRALLFADALHAAALFHAGSHLRRNKSSRRGEERAGGGKKAAAKSEGCGHGYGARFCSATLWTAKLAVIIQLPACRAPELFSFQLILFFFFFYFRGRRAHVEAANENRRLSKYFLETRIIGGVPGEKKKER